jgi:UDP-N-acetylmuramate--alanine ligase
MEFYGSEEALHDAFEAFVKNIPFYGFAVLCLDHPAVQSLIGRVEDRRIVTYGFSPQADVRAVNLSIDPAGARFDVEIAGRRDAPARTIEGLTLPMVGRHNVQNAVSAVAVAGELGIDDEVLKAGLAGFSGVKRRFTKTGEAGGITVIDDYAHHPVEIAAVLQAARQATGGAVIAVVQPHRYTRLADLFDDFCTCFNDADRVVVANVYAAGETPIAGADRDSLVAGLRSRGHRHVTALADPVELASMIAGMAEAGDLVVFLGAGSSTTWANALPGQLKSALAARGGAPPGAAS